MKKNTLTLFTALLLALLAAGCEAESTPQTDSPPQSGLRLWLDASDIGTLRLDPNGRLLEWRDKSADKRVASIVGSGRISQTQAAEGRRPLMRLDGKTGLAITALGTTYGSATVFVVSRRLPEQVTTAGWQRLFSSCVKKGEGDAKEPNFCLTADSDGKSKAYGLSLQQRAYIDVSLALIGVGMNINGYQFFNGDIAEVLVYDRPFLTYDDKSQVVDYLKAKWNAGIPSDNESWTRTGDLGEVPKRKNDLFPLSDQDNKAGWVRFEPMWDEFTNTTLDAGKWNTGEKLGWLGRQPAFFWARNVSLSSGQLHLTMRKEEAPGQPHDKGYNTYTSAIVDCEQRVLYGYFEVRARPMRSAGSSSFWFISPSGVEKVIEFGDEIDVFEIGGGARGFERKYGMNVHAKRRTAGSLLETWSIGGAWKAPWDLADDFHVFGLEWDMKEIRYYVDGVLVRWLTNTHWHYPLRMIFDSETMPDWLGLPEDKDLPSTFSIDYVRSWRKTE